MAKGASRPIHTVLLGVQSGSRERLEALAGPERQGSTVGAVGGDVGGRDAARRPLGPSIRWTRFCPFRLQMLFRSYCRIRRSLMCSRGRLLGPPRSVLSYRFLRQGPLGSKPNQRLEAAGQIMIPPLRGDGVGHGCAVLV